MELQHVAACGKEEFQFILGAMTIAIAASAAFMTPVSSPVNTLVLGPGNYKFVDFVRIGVPFTLLVMVVSVIAIPWFFPF